jgi:hypothetical protein
MTVAVSGESITFNDSSVQTTAATGFGFKNRIINGAMVIDQRNAGASVTPTSGSYTLDRFYFSLSQASKLTSQQNAGAVTPPAGFTKYLGVTSSSAYTVGASEIFAVAQQIEGYNIADLAWGTASAATVTLSFWVRSSLTGTFGGVINNDGSSRSYPFSYTISVANTWEQKSITIAGDTSGTWGSTNGTGINLRFGLGVGSTVSGTAGAWSGSTFYSATGAVSVVGTSGATFYITGVQLEKGSTATSFDYRTYGTEFSLCQRYFALNTPGCGKTSTTTNMSGTIGCPVTLRDVPTVSLFNGTNKVADLGVAFRNITAITAWEGATVYGGNLTCTVSTTTSGAVSTYLGGAIALIAEL